ncbi:MAG: dUTP diphosphatase [Candidatus Eremiobacteraeota bacterium]|nr:dUTP diphosphatase [Candidatus Eremiobacteraeota bacterium]
MNAESAAPSVAVRVGFRRLPGGEDLPLPDYMSAGAAGADVRAAVDGDLTLAPGGRALVPTGFSLAIPAGYEVQVRPRSGLALRFGVTVLNAPGTIDSDYRGPVGVLLVNFGNEPFIIRRGDRIAQLVLAPAARAAFDESLEHEATPRASGGFGSTG